MELAHQTGTNTATVHPVSGANTDGGGLDETAVAERVAGAPEEEEERETFGHKAEYWLACIGFAVGYGNLWRFPFMCYLNGGACFLIPYLIALFLIAMPMYLMETIFGQMIYVKLHKRWGIFYGPLWAISSI